MACPKQCTGTTVGLLNFEVLKIRKTRKGLLSVCFKLTVPCSLSSSLERPTQVNFLALTKSTEAHCIATARNVQVKCNEITGKVRLLPKQTYQVVSYTFNPDEPLGFTAGAVDRLLAFP